MLHCVTGLGLRFSMILPSKNKVNGILLGNQMFKVMQSMKLLLQT